MAFSKIAAGLKRKIAVPLVVLVGAIGAVTWAQTQPAQDPDAAANWPLPLGNQGASRYSTLTQINTENVSRLRRAWTFRTGSGRFAGAPLVIDSVMYFSTNDGVYALDAVTGTQIWKFEVDASHVRAPQAEDAPDFFGYTENDGGDRGPGDAGTAMRGPTYWPGTNGVAPRIYSTIRSGMAALDAKTGTLITSFGQNGVIPGITPDSPPVIYRNILIADAEFELGKGKTVKGWDVVTGRHIWTWYAKAQPGDPNRELTWLDGSADTTSATPDIWGTTTLDVERGLVFVPTEAVEGEGDHPGNNLYSDSVVALDALTGEMKWYQQLVHQPQGDNDIAAAPVHIDVVSNGQVIPAIAEYSKMSLLFMLHRETGEPVFGIEERPVPAPVGRRGGGGGRAGGNAARAGRAGRAGAAAAPAAPQWRSPTQPFPVKPLPLAPNSSPYGTPPLNPPTITPELQAFCDSTGDSSVFKTIWRNGGAYGWQGVTYHRDLGLLITNAATPPSPDRCVPPPWMELVAIDVNTGDVRWRVPLGEFPDLIARGIPPTGTPSAGASIATAGNLVFIGGSMDGHFRAFDARDGKELWRDKLPQPAHGTPSTYLGRDGKQYVVVGANGGSYIRSPIGDEVIAYTLE
jgi:quinoprotein glucose dehydrogenase